MKKAISDLDKLGFQVTEKIKEYIDDVFVDCTENPGFTFQLTPTDVVIRITKSNNDSRLISDYREMTVTNKWFHENYSHNVFKMS